MNLIKSFLLITFFCFYSFTVNALVKSWDDLSLDEQAEILLDLEYTSADLPENLKVIDYTNSNLVSVSDLKINNQKHKDYIEKIIQVFEDEVSREDIEQSEYSAFGDPQISMLFLLVDDSDNIVGAILGFYQDGRDQEG